MKKIFTADEVLKYHEDENEMHLHQVDRERIIRAMEDFAFKFAEAAIDNWGLTKVEPIYLEDYYKKIPSMSVDLITRTILGYTAEVVGVNPDDILSEVKTQELVLARSIFADIAYSEYLYTYCQIGRIIKRNHATVMHNLEILAINMRARPDIKFLRTQVLNRTRDFLQH